MSDVLIYIAGPLFCDAEKTANEAMCATIERYCNVFLPQRDGHLIPDLIKCGMTIESAYSYVFNRDVDAVRRADALIINLDGRTIDEGAAFELGLAFACNKVCVGYRTDVRTLLQWGLNPMITAPLSEILRNPEELEAWCADYVGGSLERRVVR
ncbi:MAG: nucleoside 2-deoxyribosyltransferase [Methylovirgula sp.]|uniref:nucleoside 2-deoxyribosyltransferase n=1 Tax=Methylovirgula sp. TaxID=1978224 RepID=UPI00307659B2